jgi:hypothetical protein
MLKFGDVAVVVVKDDVDRDTVPYRRMVADPAGSYN